MDNSELFSYKNADGILESKGLLAEIKSVLLETTRADHYEIQECFRRHGWTIERAILPETTWKWDAYKSKVAVSIEFSLIDAVHRDFLRAILAQRRNDLDALVYVTSVSKEPRFHNVKRDIETFDEILTVPVLLIGLTQADVLVDQQIQSYVRDIQRSKETRRKPYRRKRIPKEAAYI